MIFANNWTKAIEKSIYYADINEFTSPVKTFEYSDEESFNNIIKDLPNNIEVIAIFGGKDNVCYQIFNNLNYTSLLFDKTTSIYFVNRKGMYICLNRKTDIIENERIAVLKIDAVLSEYKQTSLKHYIYYPIVFGFGGLVTYFSLKHVNEY